MDAYVVVGALARIEPGSAEEVRQKIDALEGLSAFEVDDPLKVGVLIEATSVDEAHHLLTRRLSSVDGVMGAWPVSVEWDDGHVPVPTDNEIPRDTTMASPDIAILQPGEPLPETTTGKPENNPEAIR